ncbi:sigma factor-like helix-turn-helix DNA-binding protein [Desulfolucanica intricata]|uniref:sigma factor-like helix-turn-helix DNA-binding protein n=1 Tax=Desulfolucanica intricata TaxID=1285191 RepID=UPI00082A3747|nr:sigma factor-like helix-turn-helix DNA-binding protein [Desulfolucanica intricata]
MDYKWEYSTRSVKGILYNIHRIKEERYHGSEHAQVLYADITTAINKAGLSDRQKAVIGVVFIEDMTQTQAAAVLGISQQAIEQNITTAARKIASFLNGIPVTKSVNEKRPMAIRLLDKGYKPREAAAKLGIDVKLIYYWNHERKKHAS